MTSISEERIRKMAIRDNRELIELNMQDTEHPQGFMVLRWERHPTEGITLLDVRYGDNVKDRKDGADVPMHEAEELLRVMRIAGLSIVTSANKGKMN